MNLVLQLPAYHWHNQDQYVQDSGGLYLQTEKYASGMFRNSYGDTSLFLARRWQPAENWSLFAGLANGYEQDQYAQHGLLPILGAKYTNGMFNVTLTPMWASMGVEIPIGEK